MGPRGFSIVLTCFAALLGVAEGACVASGTGCPANSYPNGDGTCYYDPTVTSNLGIAPAIGATVSTNYLLGNDSGFVLGNGINFSIIAPTGTNQQFIPDVIASFGGGPILAAGTVTEAFTAVAVYTAAQAAAATAAEQEALDTAIDDGEATTDYQVLYTYDPVTDVYSDLTGYIVAVGYSLTTSGAVVPLIARFSPRGTLDTTFNGTGYVLGAPGGYTGGNFNMLRAVAIDNFGNIVVGGFGNTQPTIPSYLSNYANFDGDPYYLQQTGDEFQAVLARYTPFGVLDTTFDTSDVQSAIYGSAVDGYALSPPTGFIFLASTLPGQTTSDNRLDYISGLAIDPNNGIFAVGGSYDGYSDKSIEMSFIAHYNSQGLLTSEMFGSNAFGSPPASTTSQYLTYTGGYAFFNAPLAVGHYENFTSVALTGCVYDSTSLTYTQCTLVVAGNAGSYPGGLTPGTFSPILARITDSNLGEANEAFAFDTTFNTSGYVTPTAASTSDWINSLAIDSSQSPYKIILAGKTSITTNPATLIESYSSASPGSPAILLGSASGYGAGDKDSLNGVAILNDGTNTHYFGAGYSNTTGPTAMRSLVAAFTLDLSSLDSTFALNPYVNATTAFQTNPLPPFSLAASPANTAPPTNFTGGNVAAGVQLGPAIQSITLNNSLGSPVPETFNSVYGGGASERFNAVTPSTNGEYAIVVGYTTDLNTSSNASTSPYYGPLTGRSFPILLIYKWDGTFVNLGGILDSSGNATFEALQQAL